MKLPDKEINLEHIRNANVFITGGTGFFGLWLLRLFEALNQQAYKVRVTLLSRDPQLFITKNPNFQTSDWIHWVKGDIRNYEMPSESFDLFIHGAADTKPEALQNVTSVFDSIVAGTKRIMQHAVMSKARRVLIISSGAVYGEVPLDIGSISEELNTGPKTNEIRNAYGEAKRAAEMLASCFSYGNGLEVVIARCFAFFGSGIGKHLVLSQLVQQAIHENEIRIQGSGMAKRSFLYGEDLAIWLVKLLIDGKAGEIYNVGSDQGYSIRELAEMVRNEIAPDKEILILGSLKDETRMNYVPSIEKAKSMGLNVWTPLKAAIKEWHAEQ